MQQMIAWLFASVISAQPLPAQRVLVANGDVRINGQVVTQGAEIPPLALIETGSPSECVITLEEKSVIDIQPNSKVKLQTSPRKRLSAKLVLGGIWSFLAGKNVSYEVEAPNVVAGVRGTAFYVGTNQENKTYVCACSGTVELASGPQAIKTVKSPNYDHQGFSFTAKESKTVSEGTTRHDHTDERAKLLLGLLAKVP